MYIEDYELEARRTEIGFYNEDETINIESENSKPIENEDTINKLPF